jgi:antitoxin component YwqK of YwqJK toxin-antitoxin module
MIRYILIVFASILLHLSGSAQLFHKKVNQVDKDGRKQGLWKEYWDKEQTVLMSNTHYLNDHETKVCKNYHSNGQLRLKFRYQADRIRVKMFDEDGNLIQKGWAVFEISEDEIHYYYHGPWKAYNKNRKIVATYLYRNGLLVE